MTDWSLIKQYIDRNSEQAFACLVKRHMNLVYLTCRRETHNEQLAEDATIKVFVLLAQKAKLLSSDVFVPGWLFKTARLVSRETCRNEARRVRLQETVITTMIQSQTEPAEKRPEIDQCINDAISRLSQSDRQAILLRFFDDLSLAEVAVKFGTTEDAARKRVSRAVEKLRRFIGRNHSSITASLLIAFLSEQKGQGIGESHHLSILSSINSALAGKAISQYSTSLSRGLWNKGLILIMESTKRKIIITTIASLLLLGFVVTPVSIWYINRVHAQNTEGILGIGGFVDQALPNPSLAPISDTDHQAIDQNYTMMTQAYNNHDLTPISSVLSPDATFVVASNGQTDSGTNTISRINQSFSTFKDCRFKVTLLSLKSSGNEIVTTVDVHDAKIRLHSPASPGTVEIEHDVNEDHWQKVNGRWLLTQSVTIQHSW